MESCIPLPTHANPLVASTRTARRREVLGVWRLAGRRSCVAVVVSVCAGDLYRPKEGKRKRVARGRERETVREEGWRKGERWGRDRIIWRAGTLRASGREERIKGIKIDWEAGDVGREDSTGRVYVRPRVFEQAKTEARKSQREGKNRGRTSMQNDLPLSPNIPISLLPGRRPHHGGVVDGGGGRKRRQVDPLP
ncbi:hypothetical protein B0H13DRAFT_2046460 [Mycena leptocephala]|nr:hypothetical protein B0H13DRAFT_2046460 [Mycena leptocephala]